ncbi:MAG: phage terminase large subunit [Treponema sp.]|nr:phage terminase large subunit [Treponema sp.]
MRKIRNLKQLESAWNELREEILGRPLFLDNSDAAKKDRKARAENSVMEFARIYFPDYVPAEFAKFHKEWEKIRLLTDEPVLLEAFRGSGKSTFFTLLDPIHEIAYGKRKFMIFSSYNEEKSAVFTGRILLELMFNQRLKNDFGEFIPKGRSTSLKRFKADIPGAGGKTIGVRAISIGQDPRGFVHGPNRPDYVRMDDIQSRQRAKSRKFVRGTVDWVMQDLIPALAEHYSAVIVATPLNTQCVASTLEKGSDEINPVKTYKFPAEERGKPAWKEAFPAPRLAKLKRTIGSMAYTQEYLLVPIALDERIFKEEYIKGYAEEELIGTRFPYIFSWTDPSVKHEEKHCFKATICAGITDEGTIYILKARIRKESVSRMVDGMYQMYNECNPSWMFYEDNGGQALLGEVLDAKAEREGYHIPRRAETNTIHKDTRIEGTLSAPIENGVIRFHKTDPDQKELIDELLQFPDGEYKDGPDALEGVVRKLLEYARRRRAGMPRASLPRRSAEVLRGYN